MTTKLPTIKSLEDMTIKELQAERITCEMHMYWLEIHGYEDYYSQKEWEMYRDICKAIDGELRKRGL